MSTCSGCGAKGTLGNAFQVAVVYEGVEGLKMVETRATHQVFYCSDCIGKAQDETAARLRILMVLCGLMALVGLGFLILPDDGTAKLLGVVFVGLEALLIFSYVSACKRKPVEEMTPDEARVACHPLLQKTFGPKAKFKRP
jgi:hypothetical protein